MAKREGFSFLSRRLQFNESQGRSLFSRLRCCDSGRASSICAFWMRNIIPPGTPGVRILQGRGATRRKASRVRNRRILEFPLSMTPNVAGNRAGVSGSTGIGSPSASDPRGQSRYMSDQLSASSFALSMIRRQSLLACSQAAIFIGLSGVFLDVADRELLGLDLFRFLLSQIVV